MATETREVWLRGPLSNIPPLVQPVAHALMQAHEEVHALMTDFPETRLWERPANIASVGFHLQHLTGVLDRLFTYARQEALSEAQLAALHSEGKPEDNVLSVPELVHKFEKQVEDALDQLRLVDESTLTDIRGVGRAQLPSTMIGLLTHAAEHTMRHVGQLSVTVRVLTV
ncbi:DinB family protein [Spirosoma fluviale]|uniref:DinB superfamily protein n=1 Tax=Spirosoma fluviale TaxID=1597977 RepID=A0A286FBD1_9BACT|nr:DinB family protein [Spirosoma fluviale]SOD80154.1 DinB superfamily protein [Spirosoma fluviale]